MGSSDMHLAINYAINGPMHSKCDIIKPLDLTKVSALHFESLDLTKHKLVNLAYEVVKKGSFYPTVLNASNEVAVELFLNKKIKFTDIEKIITKEVSSYSKFDMEFTIDNILKLDKNIKEKLRKIYS